VRLLADVLMVLQQHRVNKWGQRQYCGRTRWTWRLWRRRLQCTAYRSLDYAMRQRLDVVWRQLLEDHKTRPEFG
jgi:hypothetical protein